MAKKNATTKTAAAATVVTTADLTKEMQMAKKIAKKASKKTAAKKTRRTPEERLALAAKVAKLKTEEKLSFRAIEAKMAKELGLDPSRPFGGFVAFNLFKLVKKNGKAAPKAKAAKKTAAAVTPRDSKGRLVSKKKALPVQTKTAPNGAQVVA